MGLVWVEKRGETGRVIYNVRAGTSAAGSRYLPRLWMEFLGRGFGFGPSIDLLDRIRYSRGLPSLVWFFTFLLCLFLAFRTRTTGSKTSHVNIKGPKKHLILLG
jgi:hypothetical protein